MYMSGIAQSRTLIRAPPAACVDAKAKTWALQERLFGEFISTSGVTADKIYNLYYRLMVKQSENSITDALLDEIEFDFGHLVKQVSDHQAVAGLVVQSIFEADQNP